MEDVTKRMIEEIFNRRVQRAGAAEMLRWLEETSFYRDPASTRYHLSVPGGLALHSLHVYHRFQALLDRELPELEGREETAAVCGLLHDICKVGCYYAETRNVKNPDTGRWEQKQVIQFRDPFPFGHGEKSVYLIQQHMKLSPEEALAVRYHMGPWGAGDSRNLDAAFNSCKLAVLLHIADTEASYLDER